MRFIHLKKSIMNCSVAWINCSISLYVGAFWLITSPFLGTISGGPSSGKVQKPCTMRFLLQFIFSNSFKAFLSCFKASGPGLFASTVRRKRCERLARGRSSVRIRPLFWSIPRSDHRFISRRKCTKLSCMTKAPTPRSIKGRFGRRSSGEGANLISLSLMGPAIAGA